jgi:hypothetical protein
MKNLKLLTCLLFYFLINSTSKAQIVLANSTPVVESFDAMNTGLTTPTNWKVFQGTSGVSWATASTALVAEASTGTPTDGGFYNWGTTGGVDRALGSMGSATFPTTNQILAEFVNTNTVSINQLTVSYKAEKYRKNTNNSSIALFYSTTGTGGWTSVAAGAVTNANLGGTSASTYNFAPLFTFTKTSFNITGLNVAAGAKIYLRWGLTTGTTNPQGISIDDVSVTASFANAASQLSFVSAPTTGLTGVNLTSFTVQARRPDNSVDNSYTGSISISQNSGPGVLSGTTSATAVAGVATFNSLQFDLVGTYDLITTATGLTSATSSSIVVSQAPITWNCGTTAANLAPSSGIPYTNLSCSNLSRGNSASTTTISGSGTASSGYTGSTGQFNARVGARTGALNIATNGSAYFQFTLTPAAGYYVSLTGLKFGSRSNSASPTGPTAYSVRSSLDNFSSDIATGILVANNTWALNTPTVTTTLSGTGTPITFRIYGYNGTGTSNTTLNWRIDDLVLTTDVQLCSVPTAFSMTGGGSYCIGGSGLPVGLSGSQVGITYELYKDGILDGLMTGTGSAISFGTKSADGVYTVVASNPIGGCTATMTGTSTIIINPLPTILIAGANSICIGSSTTITASGATTYSWDNGDNTASSTVSPVTPTTFTVFGTDNNGCVNTATKSITINALPVVTAVATPTIVCTSDPSLLSGGGAVTYTWGPGLNSQSITVAPITNSTFTVTGTDANGCVNTATTSVDVTTCSNTPAEALILDGTNDKITGTNSLLPQGSAARTFTAWIKPTRVTGASQTIFHYGDEATGAASGLLISNGNLYYVGHFSDLDGGAATAITPNVWTHVAVTLTGKTVQFYVNGILKKTGTLATTPVTTGTTWAISNSAWSATPREPLTGVIDEVSVWNRVLSSADIANTMRREVEPTGQVGLVGLYHFNQGFASSLNATETSLVDASTGGNNGTLTGFTLSGSSSNWIAPGRAGKTALADAYCGITLANLGNTAQLACYSVSNASNYQWQFTDLSNSSVYTYTRNSNLNNFYFYLFPVLTYGKTYSVKVRPYINGVWQAYGEACNITTPASVPTTQLLNVCGTTITPTTTQLACSTVPGATNYIWEFTNTATSQVYTIYRGNNMNNFYLYMLPSAPAGNYDVVIRAVFGSTIGTAGPTCNITFLTNSGRYAAPDQLEENGEEKFSVNLFPNPSNGQFEITSENIENLEVEIFDALGKVVLKESINSTKQSFDLMDKDNGFYFVRVSQNGKLVYTNKIIKQ